MTKSYYLIFSFALLLILAACGGVKKSTVNQSPQRASNNPWSESVRSILIEKCGSCHIGSIAQMHQSALAVFDLEKDNWHASMTDQQIRVLGSMATDPHDVSDNDQLTVLRFINCELEGKCKEE